MKKLIQESYEQFKSDKALNEAVDIKVSLRYAKIAGELFDDMNRSYHIGKFVSTDEWSFKKWEDAGSFVQTLIVKFKVPPEELYSSNKNIRREFDVSEK